MGVCFSEILDKINYKGHIIQNVEKHRFWILTYISEPVGDGDKVYVGLLLGMTMGKLK